MPEYASLKRAPAMRFLPPKTKESDLHLDQTLRSSTPEERTFGSGEGYQGSFFLRSSLSEPSSGERNSDSNAQPNLFPHSVLGGRSV